MRDLMGQLQEAEIRLRIKQARKEAGLSQPDLAELLGVIPRTVQNYENDHVPWGRIRDIADITGKSTRWLLHGDGTEDGALAAQLEAIGEKLDRLIVAIAGSAVEQELADAAGQGEPPAGSSGEDGFADGDQDEEPPGRDEILP